MPFRIEIAPQAFEDLDSIAEHIGRHGSTESASRWFNGIIDAIRTLGEMPSRCPLADESEDVRAEVRLLLHGKRNRRYKVFFAIHRETETVRVFHVRHWARKPADADEMKDLMDSAEDGA
jgi:plasmid stabilization system protein ParE